jgi:aerobic carbon-monoxide dehydrogenase large subunit
MGRTIGARRRPAALNLGIGMAHIGQSILRVEDDRLLRGQGRYVSDLNIAGTLEALFVRSPRAHAAIRRIDVAAARAAPGVVAVFTAADLEGRTEPLCVSGEVHTPERLQRELKPMDRPHLIPLLPTKRVSYVGQPVAMIVAESRHAALDAAERIDIEYDPLPVVTDPIAALAPDAPRVEPSWPDNLALSVAIKKGDPDAAFSSATVVVEEEFYTQRYVAAPMEPRGVHAAVDPVKGDLTVWASTQTAHVLLGLVAGSLRLPSERLRVIACDVGGGFGQKGIQTVEDILVPFAAKELGRPVRWIEERSENLTAAAHARDQIHRIAVAAADDGRILALRDDAIVNFGAFNVLGLVVPYNTLSHLLGPYQVPHASIQVRGVLTNTCFTTPYRGAGRPEAVFAMERIIDRLARQLDLDPYDVRMRNLVPASAMPYDTGLLYRDGHAQVYDSGNFPELLRRARSRIDLDAVRTRQRQPRADGRLLGVGFAMYVEGTGMGPFEGAVVRVLPSGRVQVATGASSQGQGHRTVYAQIVADTLGVPFEAIEVIGGDTATIAFGIGTIASRSTVTAGNAVYQAATKVKARALSLAEQMLEAAAADLEIVDGKVRIRGVPDLAVALADVAKAAIAAVLRKGATGDGLLAETAYFIPPTVTYASAAHCAVVAVDPATGAVTIERYLVVHDCGRVVNPLLADGQVVGGAVQGIGGALCEHLVYDETGQPLTGSFMDYAMPVASDVPMIELDHIESLSTRNPLGVKGLGEGGAIGPPAALANAIEDALRDYDVVVRRGPLSAARLRDLIAAGRCTTS